jgi:hypothetical protein
MDQIYIVEPTSKKLTSVKPVSLAGIGMKERADLEAWVLNNPQVLGEELLIVSTEFDRFEKSSRRLDVLALDKEGVLVVVELKLELSHSFADQQAIRYAAFCSTMTMQDLVQVRAHHAGVSEEDAANDVRTFLDSDELPELGDRPRIILAAGSLDDTELTSTVLWLRNFGVDITCIELTPYHLGGNGTVILVPRTIIPIPEARDYVIQVERKEIKKATKTDKEAQCRSLWRAVGEAFNGLGTGFATTGNSGSPILKVPIGDSHVHYEWWWRRNQEAVDACLHFEWPDRDRCIRAIEVIKKHEAAIRDQVDLVYNAGPWGSRWAEAHFRVPFETADTDDGIAERAAKTMKLLIERTHSIAEAIIKEEHG